MTQTVDNSAEVLHDNQPVPYWSKHPIYQRDAEGNYVPLRENLIFGNWAIGEDAYYSVSEAEGSKYKGTVPASIHTEDGTEKVDRNNFTISSSVTLGSVSSINNTIKNIFKTFYPTSSFSLSKENEKCKDCLLNGLCKGTDREKYKPKDYTYSEDVWVTSRLILLTKIFNEK